MAERTDSQIACRQARSKEMNPDVFLTVAYVFYAVVTAAAAGLLILRSERDTVRDQAVENRLKGGVSTARPAAERLPVVSGRHRPTPQD